MAKRKTVVVKTHWSLAELRQELGISQSLAWRWHAAGIFETHGKARGTVYDITVRARLRAAAALRAKGYPVKAIGPMLTEMTPEALFTLAGLPVPAPPATATTAAPAMSGSSTALWARVTVSPGIELHVDVARVADVDRLVKMLSALR